MDEVEKDPQKATPLDDVFAKLFAELDLKLIKMSEGKQPPTLNTIPEDVFEKLLAELDNKSIFALRRVCRNIHDYIDEKKPDMKLTSLEFEHFSDGDRLRLNGSSVPIIGSDTRMSEAFLKILEFQKSKLKHLHIRLFSHDDAFFERLMNVLKDRVLMVHEINIAFPKEEFFLRILPFLDPGYLRIIDIQLGNETNEFFDLEPIVGTEQWKNATEFSLNSIAKVKCDLKRFSHFRSVKILTKDTITVDEVAWLKALFLQPPYNRHFTISFVEWTDQLKILKYLGYTINTIPKHEQDYRDMFEAEDPSKAFTIEILGESSYHDEKKLEWTLKVMSTDIQSARRFMGVY